ncbi:MAG: hypothetical protein NTY53_00600 [Kiritimatiellaeota bacterium]|nr:hypothetical protein [Kiritimatiellota bacterium]
MNKRMWFAVLTLVLCAVITVLGAVLTCPKCGYEQTEGTEKCTHCGADLPKPPPKVVQEVVKAVKPTWALSADEDWRKSSEAATQKKLWLAWFYARNAYTLNMMHEGTNSSRATKLISLQEGYEKQLRSSTITCPRCKGTGRADIHIKMSSGREQIIHNDSSHCKLCDGAKSLPIIIRADVLNHARAQVKRDYDALQKDRSWTSLNGVWLPADLAHDLTLKERVQLLRTLGSPCVDCAGMGASACTKCDGAGWTKCSNMECESGTMPCTDCKGTGTPTKKATTSGSSRGQYTSIGSFCQTCAGTGRVTCRVCKGASTLPCQACNSKAVMVCKTCNGNGQNPICSNCKGDGTMPCARCRGAGKIRDAVCTECNGEGQMMCANCKGVGRVPKR